MIVDIESVQPHPRNPRRGNVAAIKKSLSDFGQVSPIIVQAGTNFVVKGNHTREAAKQLGWSQIDALFVEMDEQKALDYLVVDNRTSDLAGYADDSTLLDLLGTAAHAAELGFGAEDFAAIEKRAANGPDAPTDGPSVELGIKMAPHESERFMEGIETLQVKYGTRTVAETIQRAVDEARSAASNEAELAQPLRDRIDAETAEDEVEALQDWWDWRAAWQGFPEYVNENRKQWKTLFVHFASPAEMEQFAQLIGQKITDRTRFVWFPEEEILEVVGKMRYVDHDMVTAEAAGVPA